VTCVVLVSFGIWVFGDFVDFGGLLYLVDISGLFDCDVGVYVGKILLMVFRGIWCCCLVVVLICFRVYVCCFGGLRVWFGFCCNVGMLFSVIIGLCFAFGV